MNAKRDFKEEQQLEKGTEAKVERSIEKIPRKGKQDRGAECLMVEANNRSDIFSISRNLVHALSRGRETFHISRSSLLHTRIFCARKIKSNVSF